MNAGSREVAAAALMSLPNMSPKRVRRLVEHFGGIEDAVHGVAVRAAQERTLEAFEGRRDATERDGGRHQLSFRGGNSSKESSSGGLPARCRRVRLAWRLGQGREGRRRLSHHGTQGVFLRLACR